jgi:hypothetical protein
MIKYLSNFPLPHHCVQFFHYVRFKQKLLYLLYASYLLPPLHATLGSTLVALVRKLNNRYASGSYIRHLAILQRLGPPRACSRVCPRVWGGYLAIRSLLYKKYLLLT